MISPAELFVRARRFLSRMLRRIAGVRDCPGGGECTDAHLCREFGCGHVSHWAVPK
jgi:hypothetical protein